MVESVVVITDADQRMYNLTVGEAHTFFIGDGDWLVHNVDCPPVLSGRTLLIGEGDFSFARSLVENGHIEARNLVATSYQLASEIPDAADNIRWLRANGVEVLHGIDARQLHQLDNLGQFDTIRWNFPHDGGSIVGAPTRMRRLFTQFMGSAQPRLNESGVIELTLYAQAPYWSFGFQQAAAVNKLRYLGNVSFDFGKYPGYVHRLTNRATTKGIHPALTHLFGR